MAKSHLGALKPLQNLSPFPPPRRRPLMSQTYRTLLQLLSTCPSADSNPPTDTPKLDVCTEDKSSTKLGKENEVSELVHHHLIRSENLLVNGPGHKEPDSLVMQQGSGDGNEGSVRSEYGGFTGAQMEVDLDLSNHINDAVEGDKGDSQKDDTNDANSLVDKTDSCNNQMDKEPVNRCSTHEAVVEKSDSMRWMELDKELNIDDVYAAVESCYDTTTELSQPDQVSGEKTSVVETNLSEEMEQGLRLKEMEFETLISSCGATDSSFHVPVDEEIEEGEISGDFGVYDESDNDVVNDTGDEKKVEAEKTPADIVDGEEFAFDVRDNALRKGDICASSSIDASDENNTLLGGEFIRNIGAEHVDDVEMIFCSEDVETKKIDGYDSSLESGRFTNRVGGDMNLDHPAGSSQINTVSAENAKNQYLAGAAAEDVDFSMKKKRGPITKERRAKKKAKERIKRAEKNKKLGVKRLKLPPPIVKPKIVTYCRHYLKGRCLEGEKCKFSHDTTPLTKSKPCCHFARQSCMKGDDCPFDHQLSKYPCNNYATKGFCSRGADCLFSHEIPAKAAAVTSPIPSTPGLKSPSVPSNLKSSIQVNTYGMHQKLVNSTSCSPGLVPGMSIERTVLEPVRKPAACTPKGVSFLSLGKSLQGDASKLQEAALSSKADDVGKFSFGMTNCKSDNIQKPNGFIKEPSMRTPQGINFLSFGGAPSAEPSGDSLSSLFKMDDGVKKLQLADLNSNKEAGSFVERSNSVKDDNQTNSSASGYSLYQMKTRSPTASAPRGINFLSVDKTAKDSSHPNELNSASPFVQGRQSAPDRTSSRMLFRQSSSSLPAGQSSDHTAQKFSMGIASSSKAPFAANTPSSIQKALQSTLAFAAKFDFGVKYGMSKGSPGISSAINHNAGSSKDR